MEKSSKSTEHEKPKGLDNAALFIGRAALLLGGVFLAAKIGKNLLH